MTMPRYAQDALYGQEQGGGGFNAGQFGQGLAGLFGGLFGDSAGPYHEYSDWLQKAQNAQNPFYNAGVGALGNYQDWLKGMKNPTDFINNMMKNYQQSPFAKYQQDQSIRAGQNAASASGLTGSTPFAQQLQQNAQNISSQDMNTWLQNVLGVNRQYGQGEQNLITGGQGAANQLSNIFGQQGEAAYNARAAGNNDFWNALGGGANIISSLFL
jgi:hypothetical protein